MSRIAKKSRPVKGAKGSKGPRAESKPPRYTLRKDSLGRRYAIDKHSGKRVSVSKATKERARRRATSIAVSKPQVIFHRIKPPQPPKVKTTKKKRSEAAKRGWETRRAKVIPLPPPSEPEFDWKPPSFDELIGPLIPEGVIIRDFEGIAERAARYPKIAEMAMLAWLKLVIEINERKGAEALGQPIPPIITPRFDRIYGKGHGEFVRSNYYAYANNLVDVDKQANLLAEDPDNDYSLRELYTLYFSPEVM